MLAGVLEEALQSAFLSGGRASWRAARLGRSLAQEVGCHAALGHALAGARLGARVHLNDGGARNSTFKLQESGEGLRGTLRQFRPVQQHRMIVRKLPEVVLQQS